MRLLILSTEFPPGPGGIGTYTYEVARQLCKHGWEPAVITPQDYVSQDEARAFNASQTFPVVPLRPVAGAPFEASYRWRVAKRWIRRWRPAALIASGERSVWLGAGLARRARLPWVAIGYGSEFGLPRAWERWLTRWSFQQATAIVSISEYTRQLMLASGILPRALRLIPPGADDGRFRVLPRFEGDRFRRSLGLDCAQILLTVGQLSERKGQDLVIRALPRILREAPDTHYVMVGLPTGEIPLRALARELGVAPHVHFLGRLDAESVVRAINGSDLFVMLSRRTEAGDCEGYGIAAVEAALCGVPAVVSADSGLAEAIAPGETGLTVPPEDAGAAARAILSLLGDEHRRERMGMAARRRALREQTWELRVRAFDDLLRGLTCPQTEAAEWRLTDTAVSSSE